MIERHVKNPENPIAMTQSQAARAMGITDRTLRNWEKRGLIAGRRVGNGVKLYSVEELKRLVSSQG